MAWRVVDNGVLAANTSSGLSVLIIAELSVTVHVTGKGAAAAVVTGNDGMVNLLPLVVHFDATVAGVTDSIDYCVMPL